ncbi:MAG: DUF2027 domain-containing protein [Bacteroidetes bacterium]|nr:DUF2027 domain-containing protein [Bacteroidota bacterium]
MKFNIGDKVKFLNEPGGGVVSKIISTSMVNVAIEDGFEIPTLISDILKVSDTGYSSRMFDEDFKVELPVRSGNQETKTSSEPIREAREDEDTRYSQLKLHRSKETHEKGVYLVFFPHDQQWLLTGLLDVFLVNFTGMDVLYNFFLQNRNGSFSGLDYGSIPGQSKVLIESISREDIGAWEQGIIQVMFHPEPAEKVYAPISRSYHIKPVKFLNENNYHDAEFIDGKAYIIEVCKISILRSAGEDPVLRKYEDDAPVIEKAKEIKEKALIDQHRTEPGVAVVDLHIGELVDNIKGMNSHDMLTLQVNYFVKALESAIANRYRKVTFIHGVGNGVLKQKIIEKAKEYEGLEQYDASLAKFGVGALDFVIRYN